MVFGAYDSYPVKFEKDDINLRLDQVRLGYSHAVKVEIVVRGIS